MKKKSTSKSAFFNLRVLIASILCLFGVFVALVGSGAFAQTKGTRASQQPARSNATQDAPGTQTPARQTSDSVESAAIQKMSGSSAIL